MLDEAIITETPPLYSCYCRSGEQCQVPITGNRRKRILHGVINIRSGDTLLLITAQWNQDTHQAFLLLVRAHWRGWHIIIFEDRGTPHTAEESMELAADLGIEVRLLPRATPELNAMDHLWRHMKRQALANQRTRSIDESADNACQYLLELSRRERLRQVRFRKSWPFFLSSPFTVDSIIQLSHRPLAFHLTKALMLDIMGEARSMQHQSADKRNFAAQDL